MSLSFNNIFFQYLSLKIFKIKQNKKEREEKISILYLQGNLTSYSAPNVMWFNGGCLITGLNLF